LVILHFKRTDIDMSVIETDIFPGEVRIVKPGYSVMVVQIVVIKLGVGIVP